MNENQKSKVKSQNEVSEVAQREEEMLEFWRKNDIFNKSVKKDAPNGEYVFYDGPPFATGLPHYGHLLAGTIKDAIPRFWTMNGFRVERKWGWDCHGLPLENLIEKKLGLATKRDIETYGIKAFNETARDAVLEYADDWRKIVPRMGRFVDMENDYKTMDATYTERVWWVFKQLAEKGLVYEGFKTMHLCPRCGTTLSNFEVNQGYKDIKDIAVTVKLPLVDEPDTSLLVWTTTPWTLPGNMAAAINRGHTYAVVEIEQEGKREKVILAKERLAQLGDMVFTVVKEMQGSELEGKSYTPPFDYFENRVVENKENAWKIWHADYVELGTEGTGAVHIAPAYGEDDMKLAQENNIPIVHHVDTDGRFMDFVGDHSGYLVKPKDDVAAEVSHLDTDILIVRALLQKGLLLRKENITHSYPHCWRCDTPLINYGTTSWFVKVTEIKDKLVAANNAVKWVPEHVGGGRFGKWLEGARDWAVSRQRYWGAPLPIWRNPVTKAYKIFGSKDELLAHVPKSGNTYTLIRHGESVFNTRNILSSKNHSDENVLTEKGRVQIIESASKLKTIGIDYIYTSPLLRTKETASIIAGVLGLSDDKVITDDRLHEISFGEFEGKDIESYHAFFANGVDRMLKRPEGGESWGDVRMRAGAFLYEIEARHKDSRILIVSHNGTLRMLQSVAYGEDIQRAGRMIDEGKYDVANGQLRDVIFVPLPHNDNYELDFHRPYIDEVEVVDESGTRMERVSDVFDCWFESGSMPFASNLVHDKENARIANFISEGIDQTRGWFYSLIVLGTALLGKSPYENVIVTGMILAEDGKKMSKSLKNYPDPMDLVDKLGADSMRYYLLSSPVMRGEDLSFSEKGVLEVQRKNIGRLHNVLLMYSMCADGTIADSTSQNVLDVWMRARIAEATLAMDTAFRAYELDKATRPIVDLIDDISVWYLRRSRDRLKGEDEADKKLAIGTLRYTLQTLSLLMAPSMPFYAEYLWQKVRSENDSESVHLAVWPKEHDIDADVLTNMRAVRYIVTAALEARTKEGIKVRQPLQSLTTHQAVHAAYSQLILEEVNVKELLHDETITMDGVVLDTKITPELKHEGDVREVIRAVQDARKQADLVPSDRITLTVSHKLRELLTGFETETQRIVGAESIETGVGNVEVVIEGERYMFSVEKK